MEINLFKDEKIDKNLSNVKNRLMVLSGKGGVGKTTVSALISYFLSRKGFKTGLLDIDLHGPDSAKMFGIEGRLEISKDGIEPKMPSENLKVISMSLLLEKEEQPVIWRGPLKIMTIKQFFSDVNWGELDYLIIDSPPGTGDEPLTVCQFVKNLKALVITTPQDIAVYDSRKCIEFLKNLNVNVLGIVENMSGFICPKCGEHLEIFGKGGGRKLAEETNVPFLGSIPLNISISSSKGLAPDMIDENNSFSEIFEKIINQLI